MLQNFNHQSSNFDLKIKASGMNSQQRKVVAQLRMKQAKKSMLSMKHKNKVLTELSEEQSDYKDLRSTDATHNVKLDDNGYVYQTKKCQNDKQKKIHDEQYLERLKLNKAKFVSSVLYLTSSEPETFIDFSNTFFIKETIHPNKSSLSRRKSDLMTYSTFLDKSRQNSKIKIRSKVTINNLMKEKFNEVRNYEEGKQGSQKILGQCAASLPALTEKISRKISKSLQIQKFTRYEVLIKNSSIKY